MSPCSRAVLLLAAVLPMLPVLGGIDWPLATLQAVPETYDASDYRTDGVQVLFYRGLDYKGRPTRVFAYYGVPSHAEGVKLPAMVLVHGGGGSAFARWVKHWNSLGYAAISMDTCGCVSGNTVGNEQSGHVRHAWAGPAGWGGMGEVDDPVADHWMYHAVADAILANSLIRSLPDVDADRIGITGISWGAVITCVAASVDSRFKFAAPVYGCGELFATTPQWADILGSVGEAKARKWTGLWDPINHLKTARVPFSWLVGTNDKWFSLSSVMASHAAVNAEKTLTVRVRLAHAHSPVSEQAPEIAALADHYLRGGADVPRLGGVSVSQGVVTASFAAVVDRPVVSASMDYTCDPVPSTGFWLERFWQSATATVSDGKVSATLPEGVRAFYLNVETSDGIRTSTPVVSIETASRQVVLDDLGDVNRGDVGFWDVSPHAGQVVSVASASGLAVLDSLMIAAAGSLPCDGMESRCVSSLGSAAGSFDSSAVGFSFLLK